MTHQSQPAIGIQEWLSHDELVEVICEFRDGVGLRVGAVAWIGERSTVISGVDHVGVEIIWEGFRFGDGPEVLAGAHESMVNEDVSFAVKVDFQIVESHPVPNDPGQHFKSLII